MVQVLDQSCEENPTPATNMPTLSPVNNSHNLQQLLDINGFAIIASSIEVIGIHYCVV